MSSTNSAHLFVDFCWTWGQGTRFWRVTDYHRGGVGGRSCEQEDSRLTSSADGQRCLTLTFESLPGESPQQRPAVLAEGGTPVAVDFEPVRHVDLETLLMDLKTHTNT